MSIARSLLTRRAFTALAGAAFLAVASPVAAFAEGVTIPIIVKDTTSFYWQIVLAGARAAGKDLGVNVPELGAQSESDINGQICILENAVAGERVQVLTQHLPARLVGDLHPVVPGQRQGRQHLERNVRNRTRRVALESLERLHDLRPQGEQFVGVSGDDRRLLR